MSKLPKKPTLKQLLLSDRPRGDLAVPLRAARRKRKAATYTHDRGIATMRIRPAQVEDAAAACVVMRRSIIELCAADHNNESIAIEGWLANKTSENVAAWISDHRNIIYVAQTEGRIAGVAAMTKDGMITLNYVSPDARFNGVSKALLAQLECKALELGLSCCRLESTKTALAFYQAAGYLEEPDATGQACGLECRRMVKALSRRPHSRQSAKAVLSLSAIAGRR